MPVAQDSLEKIVTRYFAAITTRPFDYQGRIFKPKPLTVSPHILQLPRPVKNFTETSVK